MRYVRVTIFPFSTLKVSANLLRGDAPPTAGHKSEGA
jgi:hypothetical protein